MRKSLRVQAFSFVHRVGIVLIYSIRYIRQEGNTYGFYPLTFPFVWRRPGPVTAPEFGNGRIREHRPFLYQCALF